MMKMTWPKRLDFILIIPSLYLLLILGDILLDFVYNVNFVQVAINLFVLSYCNLILCLTDGLIDDSYYFLRR